MQIPIQRGKDPRHLRHGRTDGGSGLCGMPAGRAWTVGRELPLLVAVAGDTVALACSFALRSAQLQATSVRVQGTSQWRRV